LDVEAEERHDEVQKVSQVMRDWTLKRSEARMKSKKEAKRAEDWTLKQWESMMKSKKEAKERRIGR
jgi:hypothetical protein